MKKFLVLCTSMILMSCWEPVEQDSNTDIIGGHLAKDPGFFAQIVMGEADEAGCGATFISERFLLTAAHCILNTQKIRIGFDRKDPSKHQLLDVELVAVHEGYRSEGVSNDIALIKLKEYDASSIDMPIVPIAYNQDAEFPEAGESVTVIGRGSLTSVGFLFEDDLKKLDIPVVPTELCNQAYDGSIDDGMICAGNWEESGQDSCQGDSGGPLVSYQDGWVKLVGIVSWGGTCAQKNSPGVYTRVAHFSDWIQEKVAKLSRPVDMVDGDLFTEYFDYAPCKDSFTQDEHFYEGVYSLYFSYSINLVGTFEFDSAKRLLSKSLEEQGCEVYLPGQDLPYLVQSESSENSESYLVASNGNQLMRAPTETVLNYASLACEDSLGFDLTYYPGFDYINLTTKNASYNAFISEDSTMESVTDTFPLTCQVNGHSVTLHLQNSEFGFQYYIELNGSGFGERNGIIVNAFENVGGSEPDFIIHGNVDETSTGTLSVKNQSYADLITWNLSCSFPFALTDEFGISYTSKEKLEASTYEFTFVYPAHFHGVLYLGEEKTFDFVSEELNLKDSAICTINDMPVPVNFDVK